MKIRTTIASVPENDRLVVELEVWGLEVVSLLRVSMEGDEPMAEIDTASDAGGARARVMVSLAELVEALGRAEMELRSAYARARA